MPSSYDGLVAGYHKWTLVAAGALRDKVSGEMQERLAKNYYDKMLVPLYQKMGMKPISRELWMREAWQQDGALTFDADDRYVNSGASGLVRGLVNTIQLGENVAETGVNLLGFGLKEGWAFAKGVAKDPLGGVPQTWLDHLHQMASNDPDMFEAAKKDTRSIPILRSLSKVLDDRTAQFYSESVPARTNTEWVTAQATELAAQAGVFKALGKVNEAGIVATGLTDALAKIPAGKFIAKSLMAFAEGSEFGLATRPQEDKDKWVEDGISFMVMHGIFTGLGKLSTPWVERFKASGGLDTLGEKMGQYRDRWTNKTRPLNAAEQDAQMLGAKANEQTVVGKLGSEAIDEHGIRLANDWAERGLNSRQIAADKRKLMKADPVLHGPAIKAAENIQRILGKDESILDHVNDPGKMKDLRAKLKLIRDDASETLVENSPAVKQAAMKEATKAAREPGAQKTREAIKAKLMQDHPNIVQAIASGNITKEEFEARVDQEFAKQSVEGGIEASKRARTIKNATRDAQTVTKKAEVIKEKRTKAAKPVETPAAAPTSVAQRNLPYSIRASKPKYGDFGLEFEDPMDHAAYVISSAKPGTPKSASHATFESFYKQKGGDLATVESHGRRVRATIREMADKGSSGDGPLKIPSHGPEPKVEAAPAPKPAPKPDPKPTPKPKPAEEPVPVTAKPPELTKAPEGNLNQLLTLDRKLYDATKEANADPENKWKRMEEVNKQAAEAYKRAIEAGHDPLKLRREYPQAAQAYKDMLADAAESHAEGRQPESEPVGATKGLRSEAKRPVPTSRQETRAAFSGGTTHSQAINMAWKNFSDSLLPEFKAEKKEALKRGGWQKSFDDFLKEHIDGMEDHDLSELLHNFLPPEMGEYGRDIFFEKGKAGENPNLLAFLTNYKPMLPPAIQDVIGKRLAETVKINLALPGNKPLTARAERFYARIIYNHVDNLLGSENVRLLGQRNVFKSSAPGISGQTEWMAESIQDRHNQDREDIAEMFSAHPEQLQTALATLDGIYQSLYKLNEQVFNGRVDPLKAEKWKSASDDLADWMIQQSNLPEAKYQLDKWNIDYERAEIYKWASAGSQNP